MKRTPTVEASFIYGFALVIGFIIFALNGGFPQAVSLTEIMALLLLLPTWVLIILVTKFFAGKGSQYRKFFLNLSVISAMTVLLALMVITAPSAAFKAYSSNFILVDFVYFISHAIGAVLTQFVVFRKANKAPMNNFGELPRPAKAKTKTKGKK